MNAADRYGLEELRKSCHGFIQCCINVDTVCALLQTADRYVQYKCTKAFLKQVRYFSIIFNAIATRQIEKKFW